MGLKWVAVWILPLLFLTSPACAQANDITDASRCFFITQYENWRAPDANTIYVRVLPHRYYRLGLTQACPALKWPNAYLKIRPRGGETICSANDWILSVSTGLQGMNEPCIVKTMTLLTPEEVDAIPKSAKP